MVGIAISRRSRIQFHHLFGILVAGVAVNGLPIVPVHISDRKDGLDAKVEKREKKQSRPDDHPRLIRQRR
jgi:hypothetical protein